MERGEFLFYEIGYCLFIDKFGLIDGFIVVSRIGNELYLINGKSYFNYGLYIMFRLYVFLGGVLGLSVRNKNNELIVVFYIVNNLVKIGLVVVFRLYGYDYKGFFGSYKLLVYDLIYGGVVG